MRSRDRESILLVVLMISAFFLIIIAPPEKTSGLEITTTIDILVDSSFSENIIIRSGGHLRIHPGVTVSFDAGKGIVVEDGTLTVWGNDTETTTLKPTGYVDWLGIFAGPNAVVYLNKTQVQDAEVGVDCYGTGSQVTGGSVSIIDCEFLYCPSSIRLDAFGYPAPFNSVIQGNQLKYGDYGIKISNGYDGITVQDNTIPYASIEGVRIQDCEGVLLEHNHVTGGKRGIIVGLSYGDPIRISNNTVIDSRIGLTGVMLSGLEVKNNTFIAAEKAIMMGFCSGNLIENNIINSMGDRGNDAALEIQSSSPPTIIRDNIISAKGHLLWVNGSDVDHVIYDNLLTNLSGTDHIDNDGDGYADSGTIAPGTAYAPVKYCRVSVYNRNTKGQNFVSPEHAASYASSGSTFDVITNHSSFGPKNVQYRYIYYYEPPHFTKSIDLIGQEKENLVFQPSKGQLDFISASNAGLSNATIYFLNEPIMIDGCNNITLKSLTIKANMDSRGMDIMKSQDIQLEDLEFDMCRDYGLTITYSDRVSIRNSFVGAFSGIGLFIDNSTGINGQGCHIFAEHGTAIHATVSEFRLNGTYVNGFDQATVFDRCWDIRLEKAEMGNDYYSSQSVIELINSPGTVISECEMYLSYRRNSNSGIMVTGDGQDIIIEDCLFDGYYSSRKSLTAVYSSGNVSGLHFSGNEVRNLTTGIYIFDPPGEYEQENIVVSSGLFQNLSTGLVLQMAGEVYVVNSIFQICEKGLANYGGDLIVTDCAFTDYWRGVENYDGLTIIDSMFGEGETAIHQYSFGDPIIMDLKGVVFQNQSKGVDAVGAPIHAAGCEFNNVSYPFYLSDTDGSIIEDTTLNSGPWVPTRNGLDGTPITGILNLDTENHIILNNCSGEPQNSNASSEGVYINWTYPLEIRVENEIGDLLECSLSVASSQFGEIFDGSIDGYWFLKEAPAWKINHTEVLDGSWYSVEAREGDLADASTYYLDRKISDTLVINHPPMLGEVTGITFQEDAIWTGSLFEIFSDLDDLDYSITGISPLEIHASVEGEDIMLWADEDWNGVGQISLLAEDTFGMIAETDLDVNVTPVNDAPYLVMELPVLNVSEDRSTWIDLSLYWADIDGPELFWSDQGSDNCSLAWNGSDLTITPSPDWNGLLTIPLILSDGELETSTNLIVNVTPVNDGPVLIGDSTIHVAVEAGYSITIDISERYADIDSEELFFTFDSTNATFANGLVTFTYPDTTGDLKENITLVISDGEFSVSILFIVEVNGTEEEVPLLVIYTAEVLVDPETGDWRVNVTGGEGQDIYIVIEGVGSFELEETSPGNYSVLIPSSNFEEGETYTYHFSNTEGGPDATGGAFGGTVTQPVIGGQDDDEEEDDEKTPSWMFITPAIIGLIILIALIFIWISRRSDRDIDEESWE
ncbi:MAG: right-handed parallel beta-helix repeat-containing protein [Thermoplasmatota archaeon]